MKEQILNILKRLKKDVDYESATSLVDDGILDSFDIVCLVSDLNDEFDIDISEDQLEAENFNTVDAIAELVKSMQ